MCELICLLYKWERAREKEFVTMALRNYLISKALKLHASVWTGDNKEKMVKFFKKV